MNIKQQIRAAGLTVGLIAGVVSGAHAATTATTPAAFKYEFTTYYDESTLLNLLDTKDFSSSVASLVIADITGGVQLTLTANTTAFPAKSTAGTFIEELWLAGGNGTLKLTSANTALNTGSGYSLLPSTPKLGHSYNWDIDFKSLTFAEGETATLTITGTGINARSLVSGGVPMLLLGNVGSPLGTLSGTTYFVASGPTAVPEAGTYAMLSIGLTAVGVWSRRRKA